MTVNIDGAVPSGDLIISSDFPDGRPTVIAWDRDDDGKLSEGDVGLPFELTSRGLVINVSLTANRVYSASSVGSNDISTGEISVVPSSFSIVSDVPLDAISLAATNPYTGLVSAALRANRSELYPTAYNTPVKAKENSPPEIWSGRIEVKKDRVVDRPVIIRAGTEIAMWPGQSLTFFARVEANGTKLSPIRVFPADGGAGAWGSFSIVGQKTAGSVLRNLHVEGGSEAVSAGIYFSGMINLHDSQDIVVDGLVASRNLVSDDLVHVVYVDNFLLSNFRLQGARSDAIDVDVSNGVIRKGLFE